MTKKGPLSKAEKFYIENHRNLTIQELCKDLDRAQTTVDKFIKTLSTQKLAPTLSNKKETALSKQFARNKKGGSVVMTPNASIMADEKRSEFGSGNGAWKKNCTTIIRED